MSCEVTYEELAAFEAGDLDAERQAAVTAHVAQCERCRQRLATLRELDMALADVPRIDPSASSMLAARRAISEVTRPRQHRREQIMTLQEVAAFLQLGPNEMGEIAEELPAFELAGQVRVRRSRLIEWIEQRERNYGRQVAASSAASAKAGGERLQMAW